MAAHRLSVYAWYPTETWYFKIHIAKLMKTFKNQEGKNRKQQSNFI